MQLYKLNFKINSSKIKKTAYILLYMLFFYRRKFMNEILLYLPIGLRNELNRFNLDLLEEIRIRNHRPVFLKIGQEEIQTNYIISTEEILEILQKICDNSIYTYQTQICSGYITIKGGHRIGITGNVVIKEGQVINISHIYSLNFRIARQVINCSMPILKYILDTNNNSIYNTIIVSPPGRGKTTLLRDTVRMLSDGIKEYRFKGVNVGIVDERGEIAAMHKGIPQNNVGQRTDVLDNVSKDLGMKMLIRSMNPKIIVADEIGTLQDVEAIKYAVCCGVKGIFTAHGSGIEDIIQNPILSQLYEMNIIERILLIGKNREIYLEYEKTKERRVG